MIFLATGALDLPRDYWALLNYVKNPSPSLDRKVFPATLCDFVDRCLLKDPVARGTAAELLKHPFLLEAEHPRTPHTQLWPLSTGRAVVAELVELAEKHKKSVVRVKDQLLD